MAEPLASGTAQGDASLVNYRVDAKYPNGAGDWWAERTHRSSVHRKWKINSTAELVRYAIRNKIIDA